MAAGDLLLSNHTSALDVLYLTSRFLPAFVAVAGVAPQVCMDCVYIHTVVLMLSLLD